MVETLVNQTQPNTTGTQNLMDAPPSLTEADEILARYGFSEVEAAELVS